MVIQLIEKLIPVTELSSYVSHLTVSRVNSHLHTLHL